MQAHVAIGENHSFTLREALLIYGDSQKSYITRHDVVARENAPPTLGPANPLTLGFVEALVRSLSGVCGAEVLPENVLAKHDRVVVWWTAAQRRQIFYVSAEGKCSSLNGKTFPQPPLVWRATAGSLSIRALAQNKRPDAKTKLAFAPFWNISSNARVCTGTMRCPANASVASIAAWERGFYESEFTHSNVGRLVRHPKGFEALWQSQAGKRKPFPVNSLVMLPETLAQFVRGGVQIDAAHS